MKNQKKVTIVVPSFNYGSFLNDAIASVVNQNYTNWECLIIDDGSTDNTKEIIQSFLDADSRIRYIRNNRNEGRSIARNIGIEHASGEYIQFLDADDILDSKKLEKQIQIFAKNQDLDIVYSNFEFFRNDSQFEFIPKKSTRRLSIKDDALYDFIFNWGKELIIPIHCPLYKIKFLKENQICFENRVEVKEDWLFWLKLLINGANIFFYDEVLAFYRKHEKSTVHNPQIMFRDSIKAIILGYEIIPDKYKNEYLTEKANYLSASYDVLLSQFKILKRQCILNQIKSFLSALKRFQKK